MPEDKEIVIENNEGIEDEKAPIPYTRFHEVNSENKSLKEKLNEYETKISEYENTRKEIEEPEVEPDEWTKKAVNAKSWGEFVSEIKKSTIEDYDKVQQERTTKAAIERNNAEKILLDELQELTDEGDLKTEDDKNALIKFAIEQSRKFGISIPLKLANQLMKGKQDSNERKAVSSKIQSSKKSNGIVDNKKSTHKKSLDEIIYEAKLNAPK